jgi:hypothetical protein
VPILACPLCQVKTQPLFHVEQSLETCLDPSAPEKISTNSPVSVPIPKTDPASWSPAVTNSVARGARRRKQRWRLSVSSALGGAIELHFRDSATHLVSVQSGPSTASGTGTGPHGRSTVATSPTDSVSTAGLADGGMSGLSSSQHPLTRGGHRADRGAREAGWRRALRRISSPGENRHLRGILRKTNGLNTNGLTHASRFRWIRTHPGSSGV